MPRIGGGGKPPIAPPQTQGVQQTQQPSEFAKVQQAQTQGTDAARSQQAKQATQSELTGKAQHIAKKLAKGAVDQREATQEFVELVIEERFPQFKKKKKKKGDDRDPDSAEEQLEEAVTDLIDQDPALAKRLMSQFSKLAAKG